MMSKGVSCADLEKGLLDLTHTPTPTGNINFFLNSHCNIPENRPRSPYGKRNYPSNPLPLEKKLDLCVCLADKQQQGKMEGTCSHPFYIKKKYAILFLVLTTKTHKQIVTSTLCLIIALLKCKISIIFGLQAVLSLTYSGQLLALQSPFTHITIKTYTFCLI